MRFIIIVLCGILIFSSCRNKSKQKNDTVSDNMFMAEVSRVYGFKCAICHGKEGVSVIKTAPNLTESQMTLEERKIQQEFSDVLKSYNSLRNNTRINESL